MEEPILRETGDMTRLIRIGDSDFIIQSEVSIEIAPLQGQERFIPATIVYHDDTNQFGSAELNKAREKFRQDDVWTEDFLELLIVQHSNPLTISGDIAYQIVTLPKGETHVPVGPYIINSSTGRGYALLKLFEDTSNAFVGGVVRENETDRHRWLTKIDCIPVPSRLYYSQPNKLLPLQGMRFGVKDSIDISGLETGCGSKCYRSLYPTRNTSAACINRLISAGAVMVGKMRCCQWCDGQDPLERFEEISPKNPRGDEFQKPSSSSSGSATGAASYAWLDFTIGTDTGGSIRHPAGVNGIYGIRPSLGSIPTSGLICSRLMDTPGIFARSAAITKAVTNIMADQNVTKKAMKPETKNNIKYKLLYAVEPELPDPRETPKFFYRGGKAPNTRTPTGVIFEEFIRKLEKHLNCRRQEVCIYDLWKDTRPKTAPEKLIEATETIYQNIVYYELWHNAVEPFVQEYQAAHSGRTPFIEPITKARLDYGSNVSKRDYDRSVAALKTYATWVNTTLLPPPSSIKGTDTDTYPVTIPLLIYPQSWGVPRYRDETVSRKDGNIFWKGFSPYSISYCSGCPDVTIPIGEARFHSKITYTDEYLPVAVSLLAPRGEDAVLLELLEDLEKDKILKEVACGSRLWTAKS